MTSKLVLLAVCCAVLASCASAQFRGDFERDSSAEAIRGERAARLESAAHDGDWGLAVRGNGAVALGPLLRHGNVFAISMDVRAEDEEQPVEITVTGENDGASQLLARVVATPEWTTVAKDFLYVQHDGAGLPVLNFEAEDEDALIHIDNIQVSAAGDWRTFARRRIEERHQRDVLLTVTHGTAPLTRADVRVRLVRRGFPLGGLLNSHALDKEGYRDFFLDHYNYGVIENDMKWPQTERVRDQENFETADALVELCRENRIPLRGHTVFWVTDGRQPAWLLELEGEELKAEMDERLEALVGRYADDVVHWDVLNEPLHGRYFADRLGDDIRVWMFQRAAELDPDAVLFINDYNIIAGPGEIEEYKALIAELREAGAPIHAVGVQGHFSQIDGPLILARLDQLADGLDLPIWITEFDYVAEDEQTRSVGIHEFYLAASSHPAVEGILSWGFWAGSHWRGPEASMVNEDWTVNVAYGRFRRFLQEWDTDVEARTDRQGQLEFRGFHGTYELTATLRNGRTLTKYFLLEEGDDPAKFEIVLTDAMNKGEGPEEAP